jgi:hypothetical protein
MNVLNGNSLEQGFLDKGQRIFLIALTIINNTKTINNKNQKL